MRKFYKCFILLFLLAFTLHSQSAYSQIVKSIDLKDATIVECLDAIKDQTGLGYLLKEDKVKALKGITYSGKNVEVSKVLKSILANTGYAYELSDGVILIVKSPKPAPKPIKKAIEEKKTGYDIKVFVTDEATKEPLIGVVLMVKAYETYAVVFEEDGTILENIPAGKTTVETQMLGYEPFSKEIMVKGDMELRIQLQETS